MPTSRPIGLLAFASMLWPLAANAKDTDSSARPPALEGKSGCELWVGKVSGNDPSVVVEALICEGMNGAVTGQLQWSSLQSGYSIRDIAGSWQGRDKLSLHDTKMAVSKPNAGWVFCTVDAYELSRTGDQLNGSYTSRKCNDRATVTLTKKAAPPVVVPPAPAEPEAAEPEPARAIEESTRPQKESSCACEAPRAAAHEAGLPLLALALVSCARRWRGRSHAAKPRGSW
jgi:hypothetical protein